MDDAFFGTDPAKLRVRDEVPPGFAPVGDERGEGVPGYAVDKEGDGGADDLVAAADCESLSFRRPLESVVFQKSEVDCTIPWPEYLLSVFRIQYPAE